MTTALDFPGECADARRVVDRDAGAVCARQPMTGLVPPPLNGTSIATRCIGSAMQPPPTPPGARRSASLLHEQEPL